MTVDLLFILETRLKCKSSARVKIVLKKDWIVKKSFQKLKNVEKKVKKKENLEEIQNMTAIE